MQDIANIFGERIDWARPELARSAFGKAYRSGDAVTAALGFIRYLRQRKKPFIGYTARYVEQLRRNATPAYRKHARKIIRQLVNVPFMGGDWPDGRGTLLSARPDEIQVGATSATEIAQREWALFDLSSAYPAGWQSFWLGWLELAGMARRYLRPPLRSLTDAEMERLKSDLVRIGAL